MTDLFGEWVPLDWIERVFRVMASVPQHQFQVLTKRPKRMAELVPKVYDRIWGYVEHAPLPNVWLGVSIELDRFAWRANYLRQAPAAVRASTHLGFWVTSATVWKSKDITSLLCLAKQRVKSG